MRRSAVLLSKPAPDLFFTSDALSDGKMRNCEGGATGVHTSYLNSLLMYFFNEAGEETNKLMGWFFLAWAKVHLLDSMISSRRLEGGNQ